MGRCYQQMPGEGAPAHRHFVISPHLQTDDTVFSLFSPNSFNIWSISMVELLLHIFLHLLTYDAVQTVQSLTSYSTKNSNSE
jgi:hypothetical protein